MFSNDLGERLLSYSKNEIPPLELFVKNKKNGFYMNDSFEFQKDPVLVKFGKGYHLKNEKIEKENKILFNGEEMELIVGKEKIQCPYCLVKGFKEIDFIEHWASYHGNEKDFLKCPICILKGDNNIKGDKNWGFSNHLLVDHQYEKPKKSEYIYSFSLVICQHPLTKKFVLIQEGSKQGYWIPAGRVDPGETLEEAAKRECMEEAGIEIELKGLLGFEYMPNNGYVRQRMIFFANPKKLDDTLKNKPDFESLRAIWISYDELMEAIKKENLHLRGYEPVKWFKYVEDGGKIYDIKLLQ